MMVSSYCCKNQLLNVANIHSVGFSSCNNWILYKWILKRDNNHQRTSCVRIKLHFTYQNLNRVSELLQQIIHYFEEQTAHLFFIYSIMQLPFWTHLNTFSRWLLKMVHTTHSGDIRFWQLNGKFVFS